MVNTYKSKNMKFILSLMFITLLSVTILWYLISSGNFLPINEVGEYEWINVLFFSGLIFSLLVSITTLLGYLLNIYVIKRDVDYPVYAISIKWGNLLSLGIFLIFILNFFHILNIFWGIGILVVLIILSFVI